MSLFQRLSERRRLQRAANNLYGAIVAQARRPYFYSVLGVPDTVTGRFEMLALHMFVFMERMRDKPAEPIVQAVTDVFFREQDLAMRELGIADMKVPKRMHRLADGFYARATQYRGCIDAQDHEGLAGVLAAGIVDREASDPGARALADYMRAALDLLGEQTEEAFDAGRIAFPDPAGAGSTAAATPARPDETGVADR